MERKETVLYYCPQGVRHKNQVKAVLVQMGVRIKNVEPDQVHQTVGYLAGMPGYEEQKCLTEGEWIPEEVLVMKDFTGSRMDTLFQKLRRAKVPGIALKAVITDSNVEWSFRELYQELVREREAVKQTKQKQ